MEISRIGQRAAILRGIREFFWARDFLEVETPVVLPYPSQEPYLEPLRTVVRDHRGKAYDGFLRMSPEFSIKKLLPLLHERVDKSTNGFQSTNREDDDHSQIGIYSHIGHRGVFELGPVFRDGEPWGGVHNPEFTMLEWYRLGVTYRDLMSDCEELVFHCASALGASQRRGSSKSKAQSSKQLQKPNIQIEYQSQMIDCTRPWERLTMCQAWKRYAHLNLDELLGARGKGHASPDVAGGKTSGVEEARRAGRTPDVEEPATGVEHARGARTALARVCAERGYTVTRDDTFDDLFFKIHLTEVEPKLGRTRPTFLTDWPAQMAALARRKQKNSRYAERVELYIGGLELANGFSELTDADEQLARFRADQRLRRKLGKPIYPIDSDFISALRHLPPCAGMALGVDRLVMLFTDTASIDEVRWLPTTELFPPKTLDD